MSYWDAFALVKLYLHEADSIEFRGFAAAAYRIVTASLSRHELRTALPLTFRFCGLPEWPLQRRRKFPWMNFWPFPKQEMRRDLLSNKRTQVGRP